MRNENRTDLNPLQFDYSQNDASTWTHCGSKIFAF